MSCGATWDWLAMQSRPYVCGLPRNHDGPHIDKWVAWDPPRGVQRWPLLRWLVRKQPRVLTIGEMDALRESLGDPDWGRR